MFKSLERRRTNKKFEAIVADLGSSALRADAPANPYDDPTERPKLTTWQRTTADVAAEQSSDEAWARKGEGEADVEDSMPSLAVEHRGVPTYQRTAGDVRTESQAQFAAEIQDDLSKL